MEPLTPRSPKNSSNFQGPLMLLGPDRRFLSSFFSCSGGFEAVFSPAQEVSEQLFLLLMRLRSSFFSCSGGFGAVVSPAQEVSEQFFLLLGRFRSSFFSCSGGFEAVFSPAREVSSISRWQKVTPRPTTTDIHGANNDRHSGDDNDRHSRHHFICDRE